MFKAFVPSSSEKPPDKHTHTQNQRSKLLKSFFLEGDIVLKSYKSGVLVNYDQGHGKHIAFSSGCMIIRPLMINS